MAEQVLYRKYRSGNFSELIGQDHVVRTLTSALASGRLSHAYLFTGPRGVGKTSVARLLARALNCTGEPKPCNACANCQAAINSSLDVVEIDAASNRSIDAVRDLREKIGLAPTQGQYKVYIIDEVHMLTTEAFNALLKTLEEPPAHAVFILATTEAHKLPETIISRTQRFNFKPIGLTDMIAHMEQIAAAEGFQTEPEALRLIAVAARGGFRDALSLLDQLAAGGQALTADSVRAQLGYSSSEETGGLATAIANGDTAGALEITARLEAAGAQAAQTATQLIELWRSVMLTSAGAQAPSSQVAGQLAASVTPAWAATVIETLLEVNRSHWPGLALEAALVKLTAQPDAVPAAAGLVAASVPAPPAHAAPATASAPAKSGSSHATTGAGADTAPAATPAPTPAATGTLNAGLWPKVLVLIKANNNSLYALLRMYPVDFGDGEVTIKPRFNFHHEIISKAINRASIEAAAAKVYGRPVRVNSRTEETPAKTKRPATDPTAELVSSALEILGGEVVE